MTIRFTCDQCGSVLKIKDELAGTDGKCPKCKKRFIVPEVGESEAHSASAPPVEQSPDDIAAAALADPPAREIPKQTPKASAAPAKTSDKPAAGKSNEKNAKSAKKSEDDDFDPVSFLMDGPKKPAANYEPAEPDVSRSPMAGGRSPAGGAGFSLDDDDEAPLDAPPPTRKWGARKDPASASAADRSAGASTNIAKDLLAKSMEESRIRAAEMPEETPKFSFDYAGFFREFGVKGVGAIAGVIIGSIGLFWLMNSMMSSKLKLPELGYVSGKVTVSGKPQAGIRVYFTPKVKEIEDKKNQQRARDSVGVTDENGEYTLYYTQEIQGVKVGPCRVWMESMDTTVKIPPKYLGREDTTVEVLSGTNPPQNFEL